MEKIKAPWTHRQVVLLNKYQHGFHDIKLKCSKHRGVDILIATNEGWICPAENCDFTLDWAYDIMLAEPQIPMGNIDIVEDEDGVYLQLKTETRRNYLNGPIFCPVCGDEIIRTADSITSGVRNLVTQTMECLNVKCKARWTDIYEITDFTGLSCQGKEIQA